MNGLATAKEMSSTLSKIIGCLDRAIAAKRASVEARDCLNGIVIGHRDWGGRGVNAVSNKDGLHDRAIVAVTDYLVSDLAVRKRDELQIIATELEELRNRIAVEASALRFALVDDVREARAWTQV